MKTFIVSFAMGAVISFEMTYIWLTAFSTSTKLPNESLTQIDPIGLEQNDNFVESVNENEPAVTDWPQLADENINAKENEPVVTDWPKLVGENTDAQELINTVRILCWIMTSPKSHWKAGIVRDTWGRRCNILVFISSQEDPVLPSVKVNLTADNRNTLWGKTKEAFKYVYKHYRDQADWFVKADDDTYMVIENLRYMLNGYQPSEPIWFGCKFKVIVKPNGYMSGGAGYVLSREALERFVGFALQKKPLQPGKIVAPCKVDNDGGAEDAEIGRCLQGVDVIAGDSRDEYNRYTMFPFTPGTHLSIMGDRAAPAWYWKNIFYPTKNGMPDCCSKKAISFHYVGPDMMRWLEFVLYHLKAIR